MADLLEKYRPISLSEVMGNRKQIEDILKHTKSYSRGRPIMIHGPSGSGKNIAIELIAKELGYEINELTASDFRDYNSIRGGILKSATQMSLFMKGRVILIDEIETFDSGMIRGIKEVVKESHFPVILMASNPYAKQLYDLRRISVIVRFDKIRSDSIKSFLEGVAKKEGIRYEEKALGQLARIADGDVRSALIDMEALGEVTDSTLALLGHRMFEQSVFETVRIIFKSSDPENARKAIEQSEKEPDEIFWWIEENIFREYEDPEEMAIAYSFLARADYFSCMIMKRQSWSLQKYIPEMMAFVSSSKKRPYRKFVMYQHPGFFTSFSKRGSAESKALEEKLGKSFHISKKSARQYLPMLKRLAKAGRLKSFISEEEQEILRAM